MRSASWKAEPRGLERPVARTLEKVRKITLEKVGKGAKDKQLAIMGKDPEDVPEVPEEEAHKDALKKARKARDSGSAAMPNLEEVLAKSSLPKQGKAVAEGYNSQLGK